MQYLRPLQRAEREAHRVSQCGIFFGVLIVSALVCGAQNNASWPTPGSASNPPAVPANIRNAPLSADVITQYDRVLIYGGHIHREMRGKVFRDSQGRVRTETEQPNPATGAGQQTRITIQDPAQHLVIRLDPRTRTATLSRTGPPAANKDETAPTLAGSPAHPTATKMTVLKTESLGTKVIDGISATGTRTTRAYEGEVMENGQPVVMVTESWLARDLQIVILSETDDNDSGRDSMKLTNIVRAEPNPQLFAIPPGYTVKDTGATTTIAKH